MGLRLPAGILNGAISLKMLLKSHRKRADKRAHRNYFDLLRFTADDPEPRSIYCAVQYSTDCLKKIATCYWKLSLKGFYLIKLKAYMRVSYIKLSGGTVQANVLSYL